MESWNFIVANPWIVPVSFFTSVVFTYLWYAYMEYKWPFHRSNRRR